MSATARQRHDTSYSFQGDVIASWTTAMRRRGLAASTIYARTCLIRHWWEHCDRKPFAVTSWRTVERFVDARHGCVGRRYGQVSTLHQFYRWAMREGLTRHDPTVLVERPRIRTYLPRPIHDTDLALALAVSDGPLHAAIVLAATSGLRCIELCRLQWVDVTPISLRLHGKGDKSRIVPLHPDGRAALEQLDRPTEWVLPWREDQYGSGTRVSQTINKFLHGIGVAATAHQLRHWCATQALAVSGDLRAVQELLGHASPATTSIYTALDSTRIAHVVNAIELPIGPDAVSADDQPAVLVADQPPRCELALELAAPTDPSSREPSP